MRLSMRTGSLASGRRADEPDSLHHTIGLTDKELDARALLLLYDAEVHDKSRAVSCVCVVETEQDDGWLKLAVGVEARVDHAALADHIDLIDPRPRNLAGALRAP
jgi:hypothetical protein